MILTDIFWKNYELDLAEIKVSYLNWAIGYGREPPQQYRHLFLWPEQSEYCIVNSRFGRAFSISPFGPGVRGMPRVFKKPIPRGLDEIDLALMKRLTTNTRLIREGLRECLFNKDIRQARHILTNFYWLKLGVHELLFDHIQFDRGGDSSDSKGWKKGRWGFHESEKWTTLTGIRNRVVNVIRFGEHLQTDYVKKLNRKLPGFTAGTRSSFLASAVSWNKYGQCAFDCAPVFWSRRGFVHFKQVKKRMNELGWPYRSNARSVLKPLYHIALDYRMPPIRMIYEPEEGYSLRSMRRRALEIYEVLDSIMDEIDRLRKEIPQAD
jgi:hypothetical protein